MILPVSVEGHILFTTAQGVHIQAKISLEIIGPMVSLTITPNPPGDPSSRIQTFNADVADWLTTALAEVAGEAAHLTTLSG